MPIRKRAMLAGLDLTSDLDNLECLLAAALCGLAYGLAEVIDIMRRHDVFSRMIVISGGAGHSPLVREIIADTTGIPIALPATTEPVLLGSAMLGAVAANAFPSLSAAMSAMSRLGSVSCAGAPDMTEFHAAKRRIHAMMQQLDGESRGIMNCHLVCGPRADKAERTSLPRTRTPARGKRCPASMLDRRSGIEASFL